ncbi:hypothetical protein [Bosea thiooxidans]
MLAIAGFGVGLADPYFMEIFIMVGLIGTVAVAWTLMAGFTGLVSLGASAVLRHRRLHGRLWPGRFRAGPARGLADRDAYGGRERSLHRPALLPLRAARLFLLDRHARLQRSGVPARLGDALARPAPMA